MERKGNMKWKLWLTFGDGLGEQMEATILGGYQGYLSDPFHRSLLGTFQFGCGIH